MVSYRTITDHDGFRYEQRIANPRSNILPALALTALGTSMLPRVAGLARSVRRAVSSFAFKRDFSKRNYPLQSHKQQYKAHKESQDLFKDIHHALGRQGRYRYQRFRSYGPQPRTSGSSITKLRKKQQYLKTKMARRSYKSSRGRYRRKKRYTRKSSAYKTQRPEKKYNDVDFLLSPTSDPSETNGIRAINNSIQNGSAYYERIGNRTQMLYLKINGFTIQKPLSDDNGGIPQFIRIFIVYDKQPDGNKMILSDLLQKANAIPDSVDPVIVNTNILNQQRFQILLSKKITLSVTGIRSTASADNVMPYNGRGFSWYVKVPPMYSMSNYNTSTGSISDVTSGLFYIFATSTGVDSTDGVTSNNLHPQLKVNIRQCYYG